MYSEDKPEACGEVPTIEPIREVVIDGLAVLKIVKHCDDNFPTFVAGSLLGLDVDGVLEVTYVYPFPIPSSKSDADDGFGDDGSEYQLEMMKMLQKVNVDNNCVGWYTSISFGTVCTMDVVNTQFSYQSAEELSDNCVVIMYDPSQSKRGNLVIKAFRLSDRFLEMKRNRINEFIKPSEILIELPVRIKNSGHVSAFVRCLKDSHAGDLACDFDPLSLTGTDTFTERSLELMSGMVEDLVKEQQQFYKYSKDSAKPRQDHLKWLTSRINSNAERRENGERELSLDLSESGLKPLPIAPPRDEPLLVLAQLDRYCKQVNEHVDKSFHKLIVTSQFNTSL